MTGFTAHIQLVTTLRKPLCDTQCLLFSIIFDWRLKRLQTQKVTLRLTVSQSVRPDIYYYLTVTVLFLWGTLSDERTGLFFVYAAGPCQHSLSRVLVPWDSRPYFTVSDLRLPFPSPPTTRRITVDVFDPSSTRCLNSISLYSLGAAATENATSQQYFYCYRGVFISPLHRHSSSLIVACLFVFAGTCLPSRCLAMNVCSGCAIPAFRRHVTICSFQYQDGVDELEMWKVVIILILSLIL
jgi:hypothetical protein